MGPLTDSLAEPIRQNIAKIARLEEEFKKRRGLADRVVDRIADFSGSLTFVIAHVLFFAGWIVLNLGLVPGIEPWDNYPFLLLTVVVSLEAIFLSTFVLMKQSRMGRWVDERSQIDLQINLLAEREMTVMLQMLQGICARLSVIAPEEEVRELAEKTAVEAVANEVERAANSEKQPIS